jgi:NAD(P)-dependent dehydrogenase (short-subunit alcohol dehydrogenase family)
MAGFFFVPGALKLWQRGAIEAHASGEETMGLLDNKVCVITGGAGSVGLASARLFQREGARVMLVDLREADLTHAAGTLTGPTATYAADVSDATQVKGFLDATVAKWGKIDVLFSNAGNPGQSAPLIDYPEDVFDRTLGIHAKGAFLACKYGIPRMNDGGSIIITSSLAGVRGGGGGNISYITAKHAQIGVMRAPARQAAARRIRVNSLNPGPIDNEFQTNIEIAISKQTGMNATEEFNKQIPFKRHGKPEEIAGTALYLASDLSTFVTGTIHMADGGMTS